MYDHGSTMAQTKADAGLTQLVADVLHLSVALLKLINLVCWSK